MANTKYTISVNQRFGRWLVLESLYIDSKKFWKCRCDCGSIRNVTQYALAIGKSQSCGCIKREKGPWSGDKVRDYNCKYNYGIDLPLANEILNHQNGQCAICKLSIQFGRPVNSNVRYACIDHDHKSKTIRGILCNKCNLALGLLNDSIDSLHNALNYLKDL
jgi:hypothetical protein